MVLSGLVDDRPSANPDYLARPVPEPRDEAEAPTWEPAEPPVADEDDGATEYHDHDAERIVVRRLGIRDQPAPPETAPHSPAPRLAAPAPPPPPPSPTPSPPPADKAPAPDPSPASDVSVHRVAPRSFNDAQQLADRFKASTPVVLDLQGVETDLAKRLIGFASGLTYGLDGGMERLDDRVFLLTPRGVAIPAAQRARLAAQGSLNRV